MLSSKAARLAYAPNVPYRSGGAMDLKTSLMVVLAVVALMLIGFGLVPI